MAIAVKAAEDPCVVSFVVETRAPDNNLIDCIVVTVCEYGVCA